jgi:hypothetical protein
MATTKPKAEQAKAPTAKELDAQVAEAEADMTKHSKAFNAYRGADAKLRAAKKNGEAPESRHEQAKEKNRKGHNRYMAAYARRRRLLAQRAA